MLDFSTRERPKGDLQPTGHDLLAERTADRLIDFTQKLRARRARERDWNAVDFNRLANLSGRCYLINDLVSLIVAYIAGAGIASLYDAAAHISIPRFRGFADISLSQFSVSLGLGLMAILWLYAKGHYRQRLPYWESLSHFTKVALVGFISGGFIQYAMKDSYSRLQLGLFWAFFGLFILTGRSITRYVLAKLQLWHINVLVVGNKKSARAIAAALQNETGMGFRVVEQLAPENLHSLQGDTAWKQLLALHEADHLFIALEGGELDTHHSALKNMARSRVPHSIVPPWLGLPASNLSPHHFMMRDVFFLHDTNRLHMPVLRFCKRAIDIVLSGAAILMLSPVLITVALMVRRDGGAALFSQPRVGQNGKLFACYKFRSMRVDAEAFLQTYLTENPEAAREWTKFQKLQNDIRITSFGQLIRRTSIDELPQLFNVLKGDMSLVGPRPIMPEQAGLYGDDFCFYESVRPGITGPWQVSGRSKLTFNERIALESWYARNWNPWTDIVILVKTFPALLKREQAV